MPTSASPAPAPTSADDGEQLVFSAQIRADYGDISERGFRKWIADEVFPPPDGNLRGRNFWLRRTLAEFHKAVIAGAYRTDRKLDHQTGARASRLALAARRTPQ